jgi:nitrite reductase/ring-hydroxylating ferredoxin subunit
MSAPVDTTRPGVRRLPQASGALGLPNGWFVVATSDELRAGKTLTTAFMSEELVLYRTAGGEARAVTPYCPHLGAHLGQCGHVEGETLRCGFHNFRFDGEGACVATGYGTKPPPTARLGVRGVREQNGLVMVFHDHAGRAPTWAPPVFDEARWTPTVFRRLSFRGHPQETSENSVDFGHFGAVHGYTKVKALSALRTEGPYLHARYGMTRAVGPLGRFGVTVTSEFDVHVHGLGYSLVEVEVVPYGIKLRHSVFATPTTAGHIDMLLGVSARVPEVGGVPDVVRRTAADWFARFVAIAYAHDVGQDVPIWERKRFVPRPALADGDGPVGAYRRWCTQFYPAAD